MHVKKLKNMTVTLVLSIMVDGGFSRDLHARQSTRSRNLLYTILSSRTRRARVWTWSHLQCYQCRAPSHRIMVTPLVLS